jgi:hypothetical protein
MRRRGRSLARRSFAGDGGAAAAVAAARENRRNGMDNRMMRQTLLIPEGMKNATLVTAVGASVV